MDYVTSTTATHPSLVGYAALVLAVAVVCLLLWVWSKDRKSSFTPYWEPGMNPRWERGSLDAGSYGSLARKTNAYNSLSNAHLGSADMAYTENFGGGPPAGSMCGRGWNPAASAEANGLVAVQGIAHGTQAEHSLSAHIDRAAGVVGPHHANSDEHLGSLLGQ